MKIEIRNFGIVALIIIVVGFAAYILAQPKHEIPEDEKTGAAEPPLGMKEFRNDWYNFSLFYPENLTVREIYNEHSTTTFVFEDSKSALGFQIFVLPYAEKQISPERFLIDVPTGVRENVTEVIIGGIDGAAFDSADMRLGDTKEIWFIRGGYLYEITTIRDLGPWLDDILSSWKFI